MPDFTSLRLFRFLAIVCRLWLAAILLYAAVPKLQDPAAFAKAITNYHMVLPIVGMNYVYPMALFLPAMEAVIGILLILGFWRRGASLLVATIMLVFIAALASALARNLNIDCGCFGLTERGAEIAHKVGLNRLLEDVAYLFMASVVFWEAVVSRKRRLQE
jgi:putative oxidoreductase